MNIAIIGYGKMGRTVESVGTSRGHLFPLIIDENNREDLNGDRLGKVDVAIEFTSPRSAPGNIRTCLNHRVPVVSGSTGWDEEVESIEQYCRQMGGTLFHASNFSIGVNVLFALNEQLARIMDRFPGYEPTLKEVHHVHKVDAPSGTAISLAKQIIGGHSRFHRWHSGTEAGEGSLPVESVREGEVKGQHSIRYESGVDLLTLSHEAKSRDAFAAGALLAAEFIREKKGVYTMKDLLQL
ncbi:MAG: 4-hydroxy-tetrahydrodipicolinate reductase [Bacteroidales bacterium]